MEYMANWVGLIDNYVKPYISEQEKALETANTKSSKASIRSNIRTAKSLISKAQNVKNIYQSVYVSNEIKDPNKFIQQGSFGHNLVYTKK